MERLKDGEEAPAIWSITPPWGGYYKQQSFSKWDVVRNTWVEPGYEYVDFEPDASSGTVSNEKVLDVQLSAQVRRGEWARIPIPYTHTLNTITVDGNSTTPSIKKDQNGDIVFMVDGVGEVGISVFLDGVGDKKIISKETDVTVPEMPCTLSEDTESELLNIQTNVQGNIKRAHAICRHVKKRITYLAPKDQSEAAHYNAAYRTHEHGFAGAVDALKTGDCDVVNTYFAALCSR
jgi:hypothetical protein